MSFVSVCIEKTVDVETDSRISVSVVFILLVLVRRVGLKEVLVNYEMLLLIAFVFYETEVEVLKGEGEERVRANTCKRMYIRCDHILQLYFG